MPKYKDSFTDEHYLVKLDTTPKEPVLQLALRHPDVPYAIALDGCPDSRVVATLFTQVDPLPRDQWYPISVRIGYRKHTLTSVDVIPVCF